MAGEAASGSEVRLAWPRYRHEVEGEVSQKAAIIDISLLLLYFLSQKPEKTAVCAATRVAKDGYSWEEGTRVSGQMQQIAAI